MNSIKQSLLVAVCLLLAVCASAGNRIVVSKWHQTLVVITEQNDTILHVKASVGRNFGDKVAAGDFRTPEGEFKIIQIQDASLWAHDFHDGAGMRDGAYGPYFFRLTEKGFKGIGIHGTCFPATVGSRETEGCVRLLNSDVMKLHILMQVGDSVTIEGDPERIEGCLDALASQSDRLGLQALPRIPYSMKLAFERKIEPIPCTTSRRRLK